MTEQRAPQDPARELAETWIREILYTLPLVADEAAAASATNSLTEKFIAYRESLLAGAVPQEELRALWEKWRMETTVGMWSPGAARCVRECADELESLIEKRRAE